MKYICKINNRKYMMNEFRGWLTSVLINWAFEVCPNNSFKYDFALFLSKHINKL